MVTLERDRLKRGLSFNATRRQELSEQEHRGEQLHVRIVESELDDHRACLSIDPVRSMQLGEIALQILQATTKVVYVSTRCVRVMIASDPLIGVQLFGGLMAECTIHR